MANAITMFVVVLTLGSLLQAMHIHPHRENILVRGDLQTTDEAPQLDAAHEMMETKNINAAFVPLNNAFFFKLTSPCQPGYQRDFLGVCREVW